MALKAVTLGTDGVVDYVEMPDGVRYTLGTVSIYKLVRALVVGNRQQRRALEAVNKNGLTVVSLDADLLFEMLKPRKARHASPLIPCSTTSGLDSQTVTGKGKPMNVESFDKKLRALELQTGYLTKLAKEGRENPAVFQDMVRTAATLTAQDEESSEDQSSEEDSAKGSELYDMCAKESKQADVAANLEDFRVNAKTAETILDRVGETSDKISDLVKAGRKFNASRARADLHSISAQVEDILTQTDLGQPWVGAALQKLATEAERLHNLFPSVTV